MTADFHRAREVIIDGRVVKSNHLLSDDVCRVCFDGPHPDGPCAECGCVEYVDLEAESRIVVKPTPAADPRLAELTTEAGKALLDHFHDAEDALADVAIAREDDDIPAFGLSCADVRSAIVAIEAEARTATTEAIKAAQAAVDAYGSDDESDAMEALAVSLGALRS